VVPAGPLPMMPTVLMVVLIKISKLVYGLAPEKLSAFSVPASQTSAMVVAVVELTGGKVRVVNVFLSDDFHKMVGRAGRVRRPKCLCRSQ
jgi:hypothetical protein